MSIVKLITQRVRLKQLNKHTRCVIMLLEVNIMRTISKKESLTIEFKSDLKMIKDKDLIECIVAMTNTKGGYLYLGVEDDGTVTGVHPKHKDEIGVIALIANKTVPSVLVRAELLDIDDKVVLCVEVPMSRTIVSTSDGKLLRRRLKVDKTPENIPMYPYEISARLSKLGVLDYSAQILKEATLDDLDNYERERLRQIIKLRYGEKSLLTLTDEELDKALGLIKEDSGKLYPTVTGMLLIGKEEKLQQLIPSAKTSFQVLEGTRIKINETITKPLLATYEIIENHFKILNTEDEILYGMYRIPIPEFSQNAFREGIINAFSHRDYTILQSTRIAIEDEGLTISSPGSFIDGVNLDNLLTIEPHGRNQLLADALKRIGLAEKTGRGIDSIYEGSLVYGRPLPDYSESNSSYVKLFIQRSKPDYAFTRMVSQIEHESNRILPVYSLMILSMLRKHKMTLKEFVEVLHINESRVQANIDKLLDLDLIEMSGRGYILNSKVYKIENNNNLYIKDKRIERSEFNDVIIEVTQQQGYITRSHVSNLFELNDSQSYRLLQKLHKKGILELVGKGRNAKYILK